MKKILTRIVRNSVIMLLSVIAIIILLISITGLLIGFAACPLVSGMIKGHELFCATVYKRRGTSK